MKHFHHVHRIADTLRLAWQEHRAEYTDEDQHRLDLDRCEEEFYEDKLISIGLNDSEIAEILDYLAHN